MKTEKPTAKTKLNRAPQRGAYDWESIEKILEACYLCHIGIVHQKSPVVIPTLYGLKNKTIYFHGSSVSRLLNQTKDQPLCCTVSLMDGLVLARSGFHHSINYRSVVLFGQGLLVEGEEKLMALKVISDQCIPGRWEEVRAPNEQEMKATKVIKLEVEEGSAKVRTGPPVDDEEDYELDIWAGVIPINQIYNPPIPDEKNKPGIDLSSSIENLYK